jgi:hypothetical protein
MSTTGSTGRWALGLLVFAAAVVLVMAGFDWAAHPRPDWAVDTLTSGRPTVVRYGEVDRLHASFVRSGRLYGVEDHFVYVSDDSGETFRTLGVIPKVDPSVAELLKDFVARRGVIRMFRRSRGPTNLIVLASGTVLVFYDRVYRMATGTGRFEAVAAPSMEDVFMGGIAIGPGDTVYLGEYVTGERPNAPRILRGTADGTRWEVAYAFPSGVVYHVHSVKHDPFRRGYWVATGDTDTEAGLWFTADDFRTLEPRGGRGQDWRVVDLVVREHELIWGSDNDQAAAGIFRWGLDDSSLTRLQTIHNPSYFAGELADGSVVITTTFEPRSNFSRLVEAHPYASIWISRDGTAWSEVLRLDADPDLDAERGTRPQIRVPGGDGSLFQVFATPLWTSRHALSTLILRVQW